MLARVVDVIRAAYGLEPLGDQPLVVASRGGAL
jgi:hypothetical protein